MALTNAARRVLVVEDDPELGRSLVDLLEEEGFACERAADGLEALGWAIAAPFDLIVTDLQMPRIDGFTLIERLKERSLLRGVGIIVLTGIEPARAQAVGATVDACLSKPLDAERLLETVRSLVNAPPAAAPEPPSEIAAGRVRPDELCKLLHAGRRSGRLAVLAAGCKGVIVVRDGEVVSARVEADGVELAEGEAALSSIFRWRDAELSFALGEPAPDTRNIGRPTPRVLKEAALGETHALINRARVAYPRLGPFELLETLADGEQRSVHRARRLGANGSAVRVALDRRTPDAGALALALRLDVAGIARLRDHGKLADGRTWTEADLPRGPTLEQHVRELGPLAPARAFAVFDALLDSLARAHARGLPHGGLDARRVVLVPGSRPVLVDHAVAPGAGEPQDVPSTHALAPETWLGKRPDEASDLYAVGVLLYFALTGRYPFDDTSPVVVCRKHLHEKAPALADAGVEAVPELEALVARLLSKDRVARPSAEVARAALASLRTIVAEPPRFEIPAPAGFVFTRRLGEGGVADVFEAVHEPTKRVYAVKAIRDPARDPEVRERFLREARIASSLTHRGIVETYRALEENERLYLVMELVEGESLKARLAREGALEEAEAVDLALGVLEALAAAHEAGVIHRDVKPDNILIDPDGRPRVVDFGMARPTGGLSITARGDILGTPLFMSPEQCQSQPLDERSDLYSLGATLYSALAGRPPFTADNVYKLLTLHVNAAPTPLDQVAPRVSAEVAAVVERLLRKDPAQRFASAREVIDALVFRRSVVEA